MTARARFTQADMERVLKAATKAAEGDRTDVPDTASKLVNATVANVLANKRRRK